MRSRVPARRPFWHFGLVVVISVLMVVALVRMAIGMAFADRIYPGIGVAGVDLGGRTVADASQVLGPRLADYAATPLDVRVGSQRFTFTPTELGFNADPDAVARAAYGVGRTGLLPSRLVGPVVAARLSLAIPSSALVDDATLAAQIARLGESIEQPSHDARLVVSPEVTITPEATGETLDQTSAEAIVRAALRNFATGPLVLPVTPTTPGVTATELAPVRAQAERVLGETLVLTASGQTWPVAGSQLRDALLVKTNPLRLDYPPDALAGVVADAAKAIDRPPRDARVIVVSGKVLIDDSQVGYQVDRAATLQALQTRFLATTPGGTLDVPVVVTQTAPAITTADVQPVAKAAQTLVDSGLSFSADDARFPLTAAQYGSLLTFTRDSTGGWTIGVDPKAVALLVSQFNSQFQRPEPNARFAIGSDGKVSLLYPVVAGRIIDESAAVAAIQKNWRQGQVTLPIKHLTQDTSPAFLARVSADMRGIIAENTSSYAGSIPARAHNVELAVRNLNGTLVPPGGTFSFNNAVGPTTLAAGFQWGFAIQGTNQNVQTVPSVAGGICQVATSIFQPVFWAGYAIEERHWHNYWIDHYTSRGDVGLDATVDEDAGVDFKFQNNTGHYLLVDAWTANETIHVELIGTKPDWTVRVTPPAISDVVKAPTAIARAESPLWPRGTTIITEAAADGFSAAIDRHVVSPNGTDRVFQIRENYAPAQTTVLTGTG